jgi:hypothetical protein
LDFYYSDTWADLGKQFQPKAWEGKSHGELMRAVFEYTRDTITDFRETDAMPDMVQIVNEVTNGILWPDDKLPENWNNFAELLGKLINAVSKNGTYLLNPSPKSDGTIPQEQQTTLLEIGRWLKVNGEAVYGSHSWEQFGKRGEPRPNVRFTAKGDTLYAIILGNWADQEVVIKTLSSARGKIHAVNLLGGSSDLKFTQDAHGLKVQLPPEALFKYAYTLKASGPEMNPATSTRSGNPK